MKHFIKAFLVVSVVSGTACDSGSSGETLIASIALDDTQPVFQNSIEQYSGIWRSECTYASDDFLGESYAQLTFQIDSNEIKRTLWNYVDTACTELTNGFALQPTAYGEIIPTGATTPTNVGLADNIDIRWNKFTWDINGETTTVDNYFEGYELTMDIWLVQAEKFYFGLEDPNLDLVDPVRPTVLQDIVLSK